MMYLSLGCRVFIRASSPMESESMTSAMASRTRVQAILSSQSASLMHQSQVRCWLTLAQGAGARGPSMRRCTWPTRISSGVQASR
jgi:hypothetical protein